MKDSFNSVWVFRIEWRRKYDTDETIAIFKNKEDALARLREEVQELWDDFEVDEYLEDFEVDDDRNNGYFEIQSDVSDVYASVSVGEYMVQ